MTALSKMAPGCADDDPTARWQGLLLFRRPDFYWTVYVRSLRKRPGGKNSRECAYAELVFTPVAWPNLRRFWSVGASVGEFLSRERRFRALPCAGLA